MIQKQGLASPMDVNVIDADLNMSKDRRYCIVLDPPNQGIVTVLYLSSQLDLYNSVTDFYISSKHPDFKHTGLKKDSYVMPRIVYEPISKFDVRGYKGKFIGQLLIEFGRWFG